MRQKFITKEIEKEFQQYPIGAQEKTPISEQVIVAKWFNPVGAGTWYATEYDGEDVFFGIVQLFETEMGYFSKSEMESIRLPMGLYIERDAHWTPTKVKDVYALKDWWGARPGEA